MYNNKLENLRLPPLPELTAGYIVVQKEAWNALVTYVSHQTSTINSLIDTVASVVDLNDKRAKATKDTIQTLEDEVREIARALEGEFDDV